MPIRVSLKQLFRAPVKLIVYFLIAALAAALLCVGVNLEANAQRNVAATEAAFETVAIPSLTADVLPNGTVCGSTFPFRQGRFPVASRTYDLSLLRASKAVDLLDARGRFGARVNGSERLNYGAGLFALPGSEDVIIFTVGGHERITVPSQGTADVPLTVTFSAAGLYQYANTIKLTNWIMPNMLSDFQEPGKKAHFDIGTEAGDGSFYLEPGMQYIATIDVGMSDPNEVSKATVWYDVYHNPRQITYDKNGLQTLEGKQSFQEYLPITQYQEGFFETEEGAFYQQVIDAYQVNYTSLTAITTNDISIIPAFFTGGVYISQGHAFSDDEYAQGARVCLVSAYMAQLNGWHIGDQLSLSFYECVDYVDRPASIAYTLQHSRFAAPVKDFFDQGEYEIIGFYAGNVMANGEQKLAYTKGDELDAVHILLPQKSVSSAPAPVISEYTTSIRLRNSAAGDFMAEMAASGLMKEQEGGYQLGLTVYDQGYSHVGPGLRQLSRVSRLTLTLALAAAGLAVVVLAVVHALRGRRGVAAMRSLGTKRAQIAVISLAGVALVCLLGACAGAYAGHALSSGVTARVIESAKEDAADTTFTAMMGEDEAKEYEFVMESDPALALLSGGAVAIAFLLCAGLLLALEFRRSPMLLLGARE